MRGVKAVEHFDQAEPGPWGDFRYVLLLSQIAHWLNHCTEQTVVQRLPALQCSVGNSKQMCYRPGLDDGAAVVRRCSREQLFALGAAPEKTFL